LSDLIADITQNACEAGSTVVKLELEEHDDKLQFVVRDDGKGMTKEGAAKALNPFVTDGIKHPGRKVGLGLPFLVQMTEQSGGGYNLETEKGKGTTVTASFDPGNFDTPPLGDVSSLFRSIFMFQGPSEIVIRRLRTSKNTEPLDYVVTKTELIDALGNLDDTESLLLLGKYLRSLENEDDE